MNKVTIWLSTREERAIKNCGFSTRRYVRFITRILTPSYFEKKIQLLIDLSIALDALRPYVSKDGEVLFTEVEKAMQKICLFHL